MGFFDGLVGGEAGSELLILILIVLLFNPCCDGLFNEEILAVIIILWLIYNTVTGCEKEC